jgi:hypothetical protein
MTKLDKKYTWTEPGAAVVTDLGHSVALSSLIGKEQWCLHFATHHLPALRELVEKLEEKERLSRRADLVEEIRLAKAEHLDDTAPTIPT